MKTTPSFPRLIASAFGLLLMSATAHAQSWDFTTGTQGWNVNELYGSGNYTSTGLFYSPTQSSTGGNPGGFVSTLDPGNYSFFFQSPSALGNYSVFLGGTLNFSLRTDLPTSWTDDSVILLRGNSQTLVASLGTAPGEGWTNYSLFLDAQNFHVGTLGGLQATSLEFSQALSNLDTVLLPGEFYAGVMETSGLSAVSFQAASQITPVPEPSTYGLLGAGALAGLVAWRRRRRS